MIKGLVFIDLDGTLLNSESQVDDDVVEAIKKLKENNYAPIIATGRTLVEIQHILDKIDTQSIISMNGQHGIYNSRVIFNKSMDIDAIKRLKEKVISNGHELSFYNPSKITITGHSEVAKKNYEYLNGKLPPIDGEIYEKEPINMLLILTENGDEEYKREFPEFQFVRNTPYAIDVFEKNVSKGEGIKIFIEELNLKGIPTYAFGDGLNDLEMFETVDYPIAMENASPILKEKAAYVTKSNINRGIEHGLKYYNLI